MMPAGIEQGTLAFLLYVLSVALALRLLARHGASTVVVAAAPAAWLLALAALSVLRPPIHFWALSTTYGFLVLVFLTAFGAIHKSISLRLAAHLLGRPRRSASRAELERAVLDASYEERLSLIVRQGYVRRSEDGFSLTTKGERLAGAARRAQLAFGIVSSG
jgi:hypothetical protein